MAVCSLDGTVSFIELNLESENPTPKLLSRYSESSSLFDFLILKHFVFAISEDNIFYHLDFKF